MNEPFRPPPRAAHRFVPTLTEVVLPRPVVAPTPSQPLTRELLEDITDAALLRAETLLNQKLPEALAVVLHEQALDLSERLRREIRIVVRQSVTETLTEMLPEARVMQKKVQTGEEGPDGGAGA